jgi:hypothetical protein
MAQQTLADVKVAADRSAPESERLIRDWHTRR